MPNKTKAENSIAAAAAISRTAYSIPEFCAAHGISEGLYRKLRDLGLGPRETHVLRRVIITTEAATEWRREREAASAKASTPPRKKDRAQRTTARPAIWDTDSPDMEQRATRCKCPTFHRGRDNDKGYQAPHGLRLSAGAAVTNKTEFTAHKLASIDAAAVDQRLTNLDFRVLWLFDSAADWRTGVTRCKQIDASKVLGVTARAVRRCLDHLVRFGYLQPIGVRPGKYISAYNVLSPKSGPYGRASAALASGDEKADPAVQKADPGVQKRGPAIPAYIRPAGLRAGVAGLTPSATGTPTEKAAADIGALVGAIQPASKPTLIAAGRQAASLGAYMPGLSVIVAPLLASGALICLDANSFTSVVGTIDVTASGEPVLHMSDTAQPIVGGVVNPPVIGSIAAPSQSMFQTAATALRSILDINWALRRTGAVSWMTGVGW